MQISDHKVNPRRGPSRVRLSRFENQMIEGDIDESSFYTLRERLRWLESHEREGGFLNRLDPRIAVAITAANYNANPVTDDKVVNYQEAKSRNERNSPESRAFAEFLRSRYY